MRKEELFEDYKRLMESRAKLDNIVLYVHMPSGNEEIIINSSIPEKLAHIEKTYDENLVHGSCEEIFITKVVFESVHDNFDFGMAVRYIKDGYKVARSAWNGKSMWIRLVEPVGISECDYGMENLPYIEMKTADAKLVPWLASQTDMLAEDWYLIEE